MGVTPIKNIKYMTPEIVKLIQLNLLRDIEIKMMDKVLTGIILNREVMVSILKEIETNL